MSLRDRKLYSGRGAPKALERSPRSATLVCLASSLVELPVSALWACSPSSAVLWHECGQINHDEVPMELAVMKRATTEARMAGEEGSQTAMEMGA
eukprot:scaffold614_cov367-Prasinococcus_capsulatus_cf.AAC.20